MTVATRAARRSSSAPNAAWSWDRCSVRPRRAPSRCSRSRRAAESSALLTERDRAERQRLCEVEERELETCDRFVQQRRLQMELVDVEHLFGGERIVFYFLAEKRVDFRELVKDLAREYQTRIEMRQIGVRDEAKLLADYGDCGKPVCCNTHMADDAAGVDADGQAAEIDARPVEDLRPLRPAQVLPALRAGRVRGVPDGAAAGRQPRRDAKGQGRVLAQEILARKCWSSSRTAAACPWPLRDPDPTGKITLVRSPWSVVRSKNVSVFATDHGPRTTD